MTDIDFPEKLQLFWIKGGIAGYIFVCREGRLPEGPVPTKIGSVLLAGWPRQGCKTGMCE